MDIDIDGENSVKLNPMPESGGIETLRKKLHAKMALLRRGGQLVNGEAGDKDGLLEERRRQRAAMRERRRKETKEKRRKEEETKEKKNETKEKEHRDKGNVTKVWSSTPPNSFLVTAIPIFDASDATLCSRSIPKEKRDPSQYDYD